MKRIHVMMKVEDLAASTRFYGELLGSAPTLERPGYAKWLLDDPPVNLSLGQAAGGFGIEHLGIQAETPEELAELRERIGRAGGTVEDEGETTCCHHRSDKTWVTDAHGVSWEAFYTHGVVEEADEADEAAGRAAACCGPGCCVDDVVEPAGAAACC